MIRKARLAIRKVNVEEDGTYFELRTSSPATAGKLGRAFQSPTTAGRLSGLSIDRGRCEIFARCAPPLRSRGLALGIHSTILNRRRPSQLFTRSGDWDHKLAVLLGDEISARGRRAFGVFLIDRDH